MYRKQKSEALIIKSTSQASDKLVLQPWERNIIGQKLVRKLQSTKLKALLLCYFSNRLSLSTLF